MKPDLSDISQLKQHLSRFGLSAQKGFGQNFLVDSAVLDQIVHAADLDPSDTVIEVGPGPGVLSQRLAPQVKQLIAVEIDEKMIQPWQKLMKPYPHVVIINQDVLDFVPPTHAYKLVANIPYYITSPILKHFLRSQQVNRPQSIVLMIQKEVAQRICSTKKPTLLSWEIRVFGAPELVCTVPPQAFYPPPKVDSAVLKIELLERPRIAEEEMDEFFQLLSIAYQQPRKSLLNNLQAQKPREHVETLLNEMGLDLKIRPHQLDLEQWKALLSAWKGS